MNLRSRKLEKPTCIKLSGKGGAKLGEKGAKYGRPGCKDIVWNMAKTMPRKNPDEYRLCVMTGNVIRYSHYGKCKSKYNWDIDHIVPKSKNGSDDIANLQPISASKNRSMGASMKEKTEVMKKMFDAIRLQRGIKLENKKEFKWNDSILGKTYWVKASPTTIPLRAVIRSYDTSTVRVFWEDAKYEILLPLDSSLFQIIPEGRPKRIIVLKK